MPRLLLSVTCDDVRFEVGGKQSLMGLFDLFNVVDFTQPLPSFHIFAKIGLEQEGSHDVAMRISSHEGDFRFEIPGQLQTGPRDEITGLYIAQLNIGLNGMRLPRPATYHVAFIVDGQDLSGPSFLVRPVTPPTIQ